ncbi:MAG: SusC/RagA family TonB-linked outer membrane protein [Paenibacillus sp.]|nr:SusC/RagA family TonB-linked outer membrane protein [Paenibacillus sp.]
MARRILALLIVLLAVPLVMSARNYDISLKHADAETSLARLQQVTGYDFVYQSELLKGSDVFITADFKDASLESILDNVVTARLGLSWKLVKNTIVLSRPTAVKGAPVTVNGTVRDHEGEPVVGASVKVVGETLGVATNVDGEFSISAPIGSSLSISYIGMNPQVVKVTSDKKIKVEMQQSATMLSEVVITGYQEIKKEKMTGSVATISADKLQERYTQNLLSNLEGHVAGLSTYGGKPVIRGAGTLHGSTAPLLVVDGMPIEGSIEDLNPYDIESVNVLKDAAAAAIYGARAANGIIVVTTKDAKKSGKIDIDFASNITWYEKTNVDYADNYYMTPAQQIGVESNYYDYFFFSGEEVNPIGDFESELSDGYSISPLKYAYYQLAKGQISNDQLEAVKRNLSNNNLAKALADNMLHRRVIQQYNLSLRNRTENSRNNVVMNYKHDNVGKFNHKDEWLNISYKGSFDLARWLTATVSINGLYANTREYGGRYETEDIYNPFAYTPYMQYRNADGSIRPYYYGGYGNEYTQYWELQDGIADMIVNPRQEATDNVQTTRRQEMRYHADLLFRILPGLTANAQFIYEVTTQRMRNYANENSWAARNMKNGFADYENGKVVYLTPENGGILKTSNIDGNYYTVRGQLNYSRTFFDKHEISAIAGTEFRQTKMWGEKQLILGYDDQLQSSSTHTVDFNELKNLGWAAPYWCIGSQSGLIDTDQFEDDNTVIPEVLHRYASGYFNATYTYDNRYNVFGSFRKDYADVYGLNSKFRGKPLWSVGAGWNIHNEDFIRGITWINFLKLRYSYGVTGNIYQGATSFMTASSGFTNDVTNTIYGKIESPANPNLRWEQSRTHNIGADFSLMDYRLRGNIDYYRKEGRDIFGNKLLDATTGFSSMNANIASVLNQGIEFSVGYDWFRPNRNHDLSWSTNITFSYNKNKVTYVENPQTSALGLINTPYKIGYPINALWVLKFAGIDDTPGSEGQSLYDDGHGGVSHDVYFSGDASALYFGGQTDPKYIVGIDNQIRWRNFSLGFLLSYYGGHKILCLPYEDQFEGLFEGPAKSYYLNAWTPDNPSDVPAIGEWAHATSLDQAPSYSDRALHDADFIKFRNIVLGYDVPVKIMRHIGINNCSIRFQINDPKAIWTKDKTDFDPETGGIRVPSSYVFGINLNL